MRARLRTVKDNGAYPLRICPIYFMEHDRGRLGRLVDGSLWSSRGNRSRLAPLPAAGGHSRIDQQLQMFIPRPVLIAAAMFIAIAVPCSVSATPPPEGNKQVQAELIAETESIRPGVPFWAGVRLTILKEWHIYWRNPGDAGMATGIEWELPAGFTVDSLQWPAPHRLDEPPTVSYGYEGVVLLMARITPPATLSGTATLRARASWLACKELCIAGNASVALELPAASTAPRIDKRREAIFKSTRAELPVVEERVAADAQIIRDSILLTCALDMPMKEVLAGDPYFFCVDEGVVDHSADQRAHVRTSDRRLALMVHASAYAEAPPRELRGVLVYSRGRKRVAVELNAPVVTAKQQ